MSKDKQPDFSKPELDTYEADELVVDIAFTQGGSQQPASDRNLKENLEPIDRKALLDGPLVASFDRDDLVVDATFTAAIYNPGN
ncbi:MAG: hypothetical protein KJ626_07615 [Verrucomicrobia bacterium]|nr:hypothetical protein [Verrucomicrobiota bacterium]